MFETQVPDTCTPHVLFRASKWPILNSGIWVVLNPYQLCYIRYLRDWMNILISSLLAINLSSNYVEIKFHHVLF